VNKNPQEFHIHRNITCVRARTRTHAHIQKETINDGNITGNM